MLRYLRSGLQGFVESYNTLHLVFITLDITKLVKVDASVKRGLRWWRRSRRLRASAPSESERQNNRENDCYKNEASNYAPLDVLLFLFIVPT